MSFHSLMLAVHLLTVMFISLEIDIGVVICMSLYMCMFNCGIGCVFWVHAAETTVDAMNGLAILNVFAMMTLLSIVTPMLIYALGVRGIFIFHSCTTLAGLLHMVCVFRETSGKWLDDKWVVLSEKEKKEIYAPQDLAQVEPE